MTTAPTLIRKLAGQAIRLRLAEFDAQSKGPKAAEIAAARMDGFATAAAYPLAELGTLMGSTPTAVLLDVMDVTGPLGEIPGPDSAFDRGAWATKAIEALSERWTG